jgi:hypothetical protein
MLRNYDRVAMIRTGGSDGEHRARAREAAARFGLRYTELDGSTTLVDKLLHGPWDEDVVVVERGDSVRLEAFMGRADGAVVA